MRTRKTKDPWIVNADSAIDKWMNNPKSVVHPDQNTLLTAYNEARRTEQYNVANRLAYVGQAIYKTALVLKMNCNDADEYRERWYVYMTMNMSGREIYPYPPVALGLEYLISMQLGHPDTICYMHVAVIFLNRHLYRENCRNRQNRLPEVYNKCLVEHVTDYFRGDCTLVVEYLGPEAVVRDFTDQFLTWSDRQKTLFVCIMFKTPIQIPLTVKDDFVETVLLRTADTLKNLMIGSNGFIRKFILTDLYAFAHTAGWPNYSSYQLAHVRWLTCNDKTNGDLFVELWCDSSFPTSELWTYIRFVPDLKFTASAYTLAWEILIHPAWSVTVKRLVYHACVQKIGFPVKPAKERPDFYTAENADLTLLSSRHASLPPSSQPNVPVLKFDKETVRFTRDADPFVAEKSRSYTFAIQGSNAKGESLTSEIVLSVWAEALRRGYMVVIHNEWHFGPANEAHDPSWLQFWGAMTSYWLVYNGYLPMKLHPSVWSFIACPFQVFDTEKDDPALAQHYQGNRDYYPNSRVLGYFAEGFRQRTNVSVLEFLIKTNQSYIFMIHDQEITPETFMRVMLNESITPALIQAIGQCSSAQLRQLAAFITGHPRLPVTAQHEPFMSVRWADITFPRAQNCFSMIHLPLQHKHNSAELYRMLRAVAECGASFVNDERLLLSSSASPVRSSQH